MIAMTGSRQNLTAAILAAVFLLTGEAHAQFKSASEIANELRGGGQHPSRRGSHDMSLEIVDPGQTPQPAAPPPPQAAAPHSDLMIYFDFNSASIKPESLKQLRELATTLNSAEFSRDHFAVVGYTDAKGSDTQNIRLSVLRAAAVFEVLAGNFGTAPSRLYVQGLGKSGTGGSDAAKDRRVEIVNLH
jgi:outer membrane protein OmpA-like peptidoglycan-associated protein